MHQFAKANASKFYAILFAVTTSIQCLLLILLVPPFQGADEVNHAMRAVAIASGSLVGRMAETLPEGRQPGGMTDPNVRVAADDFENVRESTHPNYAASEHAAARRIGWSHDLQMLPFPNTAFTPPFFYAPAAAGIAVSRGFLDSVVAGLEVGRAANAVAYVLVGVAAVALSPAAPILFVLLTLPMAAFLGSCITPDGPMVASMALACALFARQLLGLGGKWSFALMAVVLAMVGAAKAPYLFLILMLFVTPSVSFTKRCLFGVVALGAAIAWHVYAARELPVIWPPGNDMGRQFRYLLDHPLGTLGIAGNTLSQYGFGYLREFVGVLGWLDAPAPWWFVILAMSMLLASFMWVAAFADLGTVTLGRVRLLSGALSALMLLSAAAVFGALYLIWSPVGHPHVEGVQGRYFLPIACVLVPLALSLHGWRPELPSVRAALATAVPVVYCLYAVTCIAVTALIVARRYYW